MKAMIHSRGIAGGPGPVRERIHRPVAAVVYSLVFLPIHIAAQQPPAEVPQVGLYRVFEKTIENTKSYSNKFTAVDLKCSYTSPSGKQIDFLGFFDGDGNGGGGPSSGTIWKMRFMPEELGTWQYEWSWSDGTVGGQGSFTCVTEGAGKGPLRPYAQNPRWLAYNGTEPVHLKSYYDPSMRPFSQSFDCVTEFYQALVDHGYNHLQVNWLLPIVSGIDISGCGGSSSKAIYSQGGNASGSMSLDVWKQMEALMSWLNEKNVGLFMFLGFDGGRNGKAQAWVKLSDSEKDFFARYVVSRLAPYAIIAGWNYVWEVPGDREDEELGCLRLVQKYDVFDHLRTYQDEKPNYHEFHRPEYNFAGVENHRMHSDDREPDYWDEPWTLHKACLVGYVPGKPVYMVEGNVLWRHYWANRLASEGQDHTPALTRQGAWACATAAASFTWNGHSTLSTGGLPFLGGGGGYAAASEDIDLLNRIMSEELVFYRMTPNDSLLSGHDGEQVWCLAEPGVQYLVFSIGGSPFSINLTPGTYADNIWINTATGSEVPQENIGAASPQSISFNPPDANSDWALLLRTADALNVSSFDRNKLSGWHINPQGGTPGLVRIKNLNGKSLSQYTNPVNSGIFFIEDPGDGGKILRWIALRD